MHLEWNSSRDDRIHSRCGGNYSGCTVEPGRGVTSWYQSGDRVFGIRLESRLCQSPVLSQPKFAKIDLSRYSAEFKCELLEQSWRPGSITKGYLIICTLQNLLILVAE